MVSRKTTLSTLAANLWCLACHSEPQLDAGPGERPPDAGDEGEHQIIDDAGVEVDGSVFVPRTTPFDPFNRVLPCRERPILNQMPTFVEAQVATSFAGGEPQLKGGLNVAVGAVDGDGLGDILYAYSIANGDSGAPAWVGVVLGTRLDAVPEPAIELGYNSRGPWLVDVNRDGLHDAVTGDGKVALSVGDGTFEPPFEVQDRRIHWARINDDDFPDVMWRTSTRFVAILGSEAGLSDDELTHDHDLVPTNWFYVDLRDLDGDGLEDLLLGARALEGETAPTYIEAYPGLGDGDFGGVRGAVELANGTIVEDSVHGDFNCDGRLDLITENEATFTIEVHAGEANGWGAAERFRVAPEDVITGANRLSVGDVNGDGAHDLVVASTLVFDAGSRLEGQVVVLLGDGRGNLQSPPAVLRSTSPRFEPSAVATGDLNGDGRDDIVTLNHQRDDAMVIWYSTL